MSHLKKGFEAFWPCRCSLLTCKCWRLCPQFVDFVVPPCHITLLSDPVCQSPCRASSWLYNSFNFTLFLLFSNFTISKCDQIISVYLSLSSIIWVWVIFNTIWQCGNGVLRNLGEKAFWIPDFLHCILLTVGRIIVVISTSLDISRSLLDLVDLSGRLNTQKDSVKDISVMPLFTEKINDFHNA